MLKNIKISKLFSILPLNIIVACALILGVVTTVKADNYQVQIDDLNAKNANNQNSINSLASQAQNYQQAISVLNSQISAIQAALNSNISKQTQLQQQIIDDENQIAQQKSVLGADIAAMYTNGQLTPIEMLATSKTINQYVDQQVEYNAVKSKIQDTLDKINQLEAQQKEQKTQIDQLVSTETTQNNTLKNDQSQQSYLLSMNQSQQSSFNSQISQNNKQIATLRAEQAAANASIARGVHVGVPSSGSGGYCDIGQGNGGYPSSWCNASQDSIWDSYGNPNRECTSFAFWYFKIVEGQSNFSTSGNAGWWWLYSNYGYNTYDQGVKVGAIGVEPSSSLSSPVPSLHGGYYGHVMIVLALPGTTYDGHFAYTSAAAGTYVPSDSVLVMSMNEDEYGHFMYNLWPKNYLLYINPQ